MIPIIAITIILIILINLITIIILIKFVVIVVRLANQSGHSKPFQSSATTFINRSLCVLSSQFC